MLSHLWTGINAVQFGHVEVSEYDFVIATFAVGMLQSVDCLQAINTEVHAPKIYILLLKKCLENSEAKLLIINNHDFVKFT